MYFMRNIEINQKVKGSTHDFSWGALDVAETLGGRSGSGQKLLKLGLPFGAVLPLVTLGRQYRGDFRHRSRPDLLRRSGQQLWITLLEYRHHTVTHDLAEAGDRVVVDAVEKCLDERHQGLDRLVLLLQRLVFLVVDEPPKYGCSDFHCSALLSLGLECAIKPIWFDY